MNCLYFACTDCKLCIDAGYRWAYWQLEHPGIVRQGDPVSLEKVLAAAGYWEPSAGDQTDWLMQEVLPGAARFFAKHGRHHLIFFDEQKLYSEDGEDLIYTEIDTTRSGRPNCWDAPYSLGKLDPLQIPWPAPWEALTGSSARGAESELRRELPPGHVLHERAFRAIGLRRGSDDSLFYLGETAPQFAEVHLTWRRETLPGYPATQLYATLGHWLAASFDPDFGHLSG